MRIFSAKVRGGVIVCDGLEELPEGTIVTVAADDGEPSFTASPEEEAELLAALADPAEPIPAEEVLRRLK
jgi:hypothetical protein